MISSVSDVPPNAAVEDLGARLIALERAALDRWGRGDPSGFLEISAPEVTYFEPFLESRLDGLEALSRHYEDLRGKVRIDRYEIHAPKVHHAGEMAVLSFAFRSYGGNDRHHWNCTEVYRRMEGQWKIVHTHWSIVQPIK